MTGRRCNESFEPPVPPSPPEPPFEPGRPLNFRRLAAMFGGRRGGWHGDLGPFHFDFDFDDEGGWGRRRRRRSRVFESGELRLVLLKLIADEPRHGYDLIRAIEDLTGGEYAPSPGVVYPTLTLLQDMGFIEESDAEGQRKAYAATDAGRQHLEEKSDEVDELFERLEELAPRKRYTAGPAIGRAVKNLMSALSQRVSREGLNDELLHEIAAILDDAAQRIERIK